VQQTPAGDTILNGGPLRVIISVGDDLVIDVTDDGVGIPDTVTRSGLRNMARRAADSGGSCIIERPETGGPACFGPRRCPSES
jgi:nitrate/nitrite-specific signal transduction histidine kinase